MTTSTEPLTAWEIELADSLRVDVDLSKDVPCAWLDPKCDAPATWLQVNECCGMSNPHCDEHRERAEEVLAVMLTRGGYDCRKCNAVNSKYTWRPI